MSRGERWRRALSRFGPLMLLFYTDMYIRHDYTGMVFTPAIVILLIGFGYLYVRWRRRRARSQTSIERPFLNRNNQ